MEKELQLEDLFKILKKNLTFILIVSLFTTAATFIITNYYITKKYESSALIYVENNQSNSESVNINDINAAQKLVNTCQIIFKSNTMMERIIENLQLSYTKTELYEMITTQSVNNTEVMKITVESANSREAASIVNALLDYAGEEFERIIKSGSFEIVDFGEVNTVPSFPNVPLYSVIGLLAGFIISYIIAFFKEIFDVIIKHDDDLSKLYNVPLFAEVPDFEGDNDSNINSYDYAYAGSRLKTDKNKQKKKTGKKNTVSDRVEHMLNDKTAFSITEAYNSGRTNILFAAAPYEHKIIVFTSSNPKEGKSTTCINTSITFAKAGYKTLLIDCDLRKPVIYNYFRIEKELGLSSILGGFCSVGDAINEEVIPNLDVIAVGDIPPNPSELIGSPSMLKLLEASVETYDYIFLDTPPVNVVTDSQLMNHIIAGIVFVVRENSTTHPDIQKSFDKITLANGRALGIIKTHCRFRNKKYGKYGKKYGYGYDSAG